MESIFGPGSLSPTRRAVAAGVFAASLGGAGVLRSQPRRPPIVIARGGAAGGWAAGSRGAYDQAASDGADFLESGLVPTKDGVLIARQDDELGADTNVAARPEFADRRTTRVIDGQTREGWFCEDFTLPEIKSLLLLPPSGKDHRATAARAQPMTILTLEDLIATARAASVREARVVGVYLRLLHPGYFAKLDLPMEGSLAHTLRAQGYASPAAAAFVASDDAGSLKAVADLVRVRRVRRLSASGELTADAVEAQAGKAAAIAVPAALLLDLTTPKVLKTTPLADAAHTAGLAVHAYVPDEGFPPPPLKTGDARRALAALFAGGVDGISGDEADPVVKARADARGHGV